MRTETIVCDCCRKDITKANRGVINFQGFGANKLLTDVCQECFKYALAAALNPITEETANV